MLGMLILAFNCQTYQSLFVVEVHQVVYSILYWRNSKLYGMFVTLGAGTGKALPAQRTNRIAN